MSHISIDKAIMEKTKRGVDNLDVGWMFLDLEINLGGRDVNNKILLVKLT